ncbi:glycine zipper 2TM domain-containing protein [Sulfurospirillum sp.]|jgi:uncharacterized protein YcfJ|uniref:glycine zipper 2TM domain-containing protein n=1 Tax=Sulfurospirillum sp. TaxID=2053622 RepID=UPI002FDE9B27
MKKIFYAPLLLLGPLLYAESMSFQEEVRVITSKPEYRMVTSRVPYQECWDEQIETHYAPAPQSNDGSGVVGGVLGGVAGGVLGHQIGSGRGNTAATVGGAIVGTLVGKNLAEQNSYSPPPPPTYRTERRCTTRYEEKSAEKFMGYRNTATYKNQSIVKYSDQPLEFIHITVTVNY